ncbi:MAG: methyltransferase domain-containing protein [Verrucomicrobiota bacterium]|jgi:SAM-dependent methyltransferase
MIIHRLILQHLRHGGDAAFYLLQAEDAIAWLKRNGVTIGPGMAVLDLGCGSGVFGEALRKLGCSVVFADDNNWLSPGTPGELFRRVNIEKDDLAALGQYDLVVCSNVIEHLSNPGRLLAAFGSLLRPRGRLYLSWTNWLSLWGGHDFSPFHYLGPRLGPKVFDRLIRQPRLLKPFENLFPTYIGQTLRAIRRQPNLRVVRVVPRYYTEFGFLMRIPIVREFLAWNCAVLIERKG